MCKLFQDNVILQLSRKSGESAKIYRVIMLMNSSGTNYVLNEHDDLAHILYNVSLRFWCKFGKSLFNTIC